jgi:hypothetical protein
MLPAGGIVIGGAPAVPPIVQESTIVSRLVGRLTWQGLPVADVEAVTVTRGRLEDGQLRRWYLAGYLTHANRLLLTKTPLVFKMPYKAGAWYWPVVAFTVTDALISADLGPPIVPESVAAVSALQRLTQLQSYVQPGAQLHRLAQLQRLVR